MPFYTKNTPNLLAMTKRAAEESKTYQPGAVIAVVLAAMGVESFINDILAEVSWHENQGSLDAFSPVKELAAAKIDEMLSVLDKIRLIGGTLTGQPYDLGRLPFQDLHLLLAIRNDLVHSHPEELQVVDALTLEGKRTHHQEEPHPLVVRLVNRHIVQSPPPNVLTSLLAVLHHPRVGAWAYNTAVSVNSQLIQLFSPGWQVILAAHS